MSMPSDPRTYAGLLSDGRTATAIPVTVRLAGDGVAITLPEDRKPSVWPYADLRSSVPLRRDAADVVLSRMPARAESLFVVDPRFTGALLQRAPALSAARQRWMGLRPGLTVFAVVACIAGGIKVSGFEPAKTLARMLPQKTRETMGANVIASLSRNRNTCETPASRLALDHLTRRLLGTPEGRPLPVRVMLLDWSLVNAFTAPGGQIILTRGLVGQAGSSDEVAGVLAHELGHAVELHPEAGLIRALGLASAAQLVLVGASGTFTNLGVALTQLRYTRNAEREADTHAVIFLRGAGISAKGLAEFFERLEKRSGPSGKSAARGTGIELISTHPLTAERIAFVRAQPTYESTPALSTADWRALQQACEHTPTLEPGGGATIQANEERVATPEPSTKAPPDKTAEADREIAAASKVLEANPDDVAALQRRGRAYGARGRHQEALVDYTQAARLKPEDATLHYGRGFALQNLRRYEEALTAYDEALRLSSTYANARNNRGNVYRMLKRYDAALADFDELIRTSPNFIHGHYNRGLVLREMERPEDAIHEFEATLSQDADYTAAYTSRGMAYEKAGLRDKAVADFRTALARPAKYSNGAWAHRVAGEHLKALGETVP